MLSQECTVMSRPTKRTARREEHDGQGGVDLQPSHRRQLLLHDRGELLAVAADHPGLPQRRGALVEADRVMRCAQLVCSLRRSWYSSSRARHSNTGEGGT